MYGNTPIDYRNARRAFAGELLAKAINWDFVSHNLDGRGVERVDQAS